jgi:mercuric ion transport protein
MTIKSDNGYWLVYRASRLECADGAACARRLVKAGLVVATALVVAAIAFDALAPLLLHS